LFNSLFSPKFCYQWKWLKLTPQKGWLRRPDVLWGMLQLGLPHESECTRYLNVPMATPAFVDDFPIKPQFIVNFLATFDDTGGYLKIPGKSPLSHWVFLISLPLEIADWTQILPSASFGTSVGLMNPWDSRKSLNN